jgi:hypothetical protein
MVAGWIVVGFLGVANGSIAVQSRLSCPSADAVSERLRAMVAPAPSSGDVATITSERGALLIELHRGDGRLGARRLNPDGSCAEAPPRSRW